MTDDGDLRARLARRDPARRPEAEAITSRTAQEIRERAMQTIERAEQAPERTGRRGRWTVAVAAAAAAAVVVGVGLTTRGGGDDAGPRRAPETLTLRAPGGGGAAVSSCVPFDVAFLRDMPIAFGGTATAVTEGSVTLDVDRWYKGGSAEVVTVTNSSGGNVSIEGVEFQQGVRYLVTASADGEVTACGFSGPATAELEKAFGEAFGTP